VLVSEAIKAAGHEGKVKISMDCAASEFHGAC
jgi:enolase